MNSDIRIQMSFYSNTKIKKLRRTLGAEAVLSLIYLWLYTAENRPHGELRGMDENDIAVAAQWEGDVKEFVSTIQQFGFIDKKGNQFVVHDWKKNNPWAAKAPERKKKAQQAARAKHAKKKEKQVCNEQVLAGAPSPFLSLPSPFLSLPSPEEEGAATEKPLRLVRDSDLLSDSIREMVEKRRAFIRENFGFTDEEINIETEEIIATARGSTVKPGADPWPFISRELKKTRDIRSSYGQRTHSGTGATRTKATGTENSRATEQPDTSDPNYWRGDFPDRTDEPY